MRRRSPISSWSATLRVTWCSSSLELLGGDEGGTATVDDLALLRLLTPVVKLYTAKQAIAVASEVVESFGGAGYIEDTGVPRLSATRRCWRSGRARQCAESRYARAIDGGVLTEALATLRQRADALQATGALSLPVSRVVRALEDIARHARDRPPSAARDASARGLAFSIARTTAALLMAEHASWAAGRSADRRPLIAAHRWCARPLTVLEEIGADDLDDSRRLLE